MGENVDLLTQINEQKMELHNLRQKIKVHIQKIEMYQGDAAGLGDSFADQELDSNLQQQQFEIEHLSAQIQNIENGNMMIKQQRAQMGQMPDQQMYQQPYEEMQAQPMPGMEGMDPMEMEQ